MPNLSGIFGSASDDDSIESTFIGKVVLWIAIIVSLLLMSWLTRTFSIPAEPGFSVSLLQQSGSFVALLVLLIGMIGVMLVSAVVGSSLHSDAPVFCTALSCGVITLRGGTMQATLFAANGPGVFTTLALETVLLFAMLFVAWQVLQRLRVSSSDPLKVEEIHEPEALDEKLLAVFTQAAAMMAIMILLCRSDAKGQCLASVGVSSAAAAAIAVQMVKVRSTFWLWIGPLFVALFGYIFAIFHADGWQVGLLHGPLAALARPLPLDYVSMGPAGAIFGYWLSGGGAAEQSELDAEPASS
jgi:hypothetical protein